MTSGPRVRIYKDIAGEWRFTYWKSSDRVTTSNDGYKNRQHALDMVAELFPGVPVEVVEGDDE